MQHYELKEVFFKYNGSESKDLMSLSFQVIDVRKFVGCPQVDGESFFGQPSEDGAEELSAPSDSCDKQLSRAVYVV